MLIAQQNTFMIDRVEYPLS